jgi:hypothetical protein
MPLPKNMNDALTPVESIDNLSKLIKEILSNENIEQKTELKNPVDYALIQNVSDMLKTYQKDGKYLFPRSIAFLDNLVHQICIFNVSKERKGKSELTDIAKALATMSSMPHQLPNTNLMK